MPLVAPPRVEVASKWRKGAPSGFQFLSRDVNVDDYTRYVSILLAGLSIQAANGSTEAELKRTARLALKRLGWKKAGG